MTAEDVAAFNKLLIQSHRVGQGAYAPEDAVRATLVRLANGFATGTTARPELAEHVVASLNGGAAPRVRLLGSVGQADLAPNADLAHGILDGFELAAGEALALVNNNSFSTGLATLAVADAEHGCSPASRWRAPSTSRPSPPISRSSTPLSRVPARTRGCARRSSGCGPSSRQCALGARRRAQPAGPAQLPRRPAGARRGSRCARVRAQLTIELNSSQSNPLVVAEEEIVSSLNVEIAPLAAALDFLRIALAPALTTANERQMKLLQAPFTGLTDGLAAGSGHEDGLAELGNVGMALTGEARLLAQPVSFELASTTQAEGIEDRMTLAPLAARRVAEMVGLGEGIAAIELVVAAQAIDLRQPSALGAGTRRAHEAVRAVVPFTGAGEALPSDLEPVRELVRSGALR